MHGWSVNSLVPSQGTVTAGLWTSCQFSEGQLMPHRAPASRLQIGFSPVRCYWLFLPQEASGVNPELYLLHLYPELGAYL